MSARVGRNKIIEDRKEFDSLYHAIQDAFHHLHSQKSQSHALTKFVLHLAHDVNRPRSHGYQIKGQILDEGISAKCGGAKRGKETTFQDATAKKLTGNGQYTEQ